MNDPQLKPNRVTFVLPGRNRSGGVRVTVEMANRLLDRGYETRIVLPQRSIWNLGKLRSKAKELWLSMQRYEDVDWTALYRGRIESYYDINQLTFLHKEIIIAVGIYTIRDVLSLNSNVIKVRFNHGFSVGIDNLTSELWGLPMTTIAVSNTLVPRLEKLSGGKVTAVVPNGISTAEYYIETMHRDGIGIMYSSHPNKNPEHLVELLHAIRNKWPSIPQYSFGTERRPASLKHVHYFRYPSIAKARELYNRSLMWLLVSREEGLPGPILEEIINHGVNGFLVPVGNTKGFLDSVAFLLNESECRERIVGNSQETVRSFTWDNAVDKMESFLSTLRS